MDFHNIGRATLVGSVLAGPVKTVTLTPAHHLLLGYLASVDRPVPPAELRTALWGARAPYRDPGGLPVQLVFLRRVLNEVGAEATIRFTRRAGYALFTSGTE